jgi:hypothetical protein
VPVEPEPALVERPARELPELPAELIRERAEALGVGGRLGARDHRPRSRVPGLVAGGVASARRSTSR